MTATLGAIWRHPIKSIGSEALSDVALTAGAWLPLDRVWAVEHAAARPETGWRGKANFLRTVTGPALMAVTTRWQAGRMILDHPDRGTVAIDPDAPDQAALLDWLEPLWPEDQPRPTGLVRAEAAHLTDVPDPWISLHGTASHRAVQERAGQALSIHRWRGNLWIDGTAPWEEFDWIGRTIRIGRATLAVRERIGRCKATMANPETGRRDVDTLEALRHWGHQDFGVYAEVVEGGEIAPGDTVAW